ncbi:diguanylate cyclase [Oryzisolibacter propanilivorax]|uniref:diguanylate cyclase n=1 Tax=Oryzisolibacter propanilivorax TaxID=1527607 RepID=A0A1G9TF09_9BURK|nr:sensor domain-containing diguanylate cyclase [Oryzisolibacter propanilivorax]SDM45735.1 diguanylate cyclase [Oryzisolibacter propanilivorax]
MRLLSRLGRASLRVQIMLVFGTLVLVLALLLSLGFSELLRQSTQRSVGAALRHVAENANTLLADGLLTRQREAQVLASAQNIWEHGLDTADGRHLLERHKSLDPFNSWIGVAAPDGAVLNATGGMLVGQSVRERPWFQQGLAQSYVGDVHPAKLLDKLLPPTAYGEPNRFLDFAAPIRLRGEVVGVLGVHGSWEWTRHVLQSLVPQSARARGVELFIFNREGQLILAPAARDAMLEAKSQQLPAALASGGSDAPDRDSASPDGETAVVRWDDGVRYLTATTRLAARTTASDLGWTIVARQPIGMAFEEADRLVRLTLACGLAAVLLAWLLAWRAAHRLGHDLETLAGAAARVHAGDSEAHIPEMRSSTEARQLGQALAGMTQRLLAANQALEETVQQRTRQLQQALQALERQASTDPLTGVLNRRGFDARMVALLGLARRSARPLSVVALDVDHFKRINDTHGHGAGDEVLRRLAASLQARARRSDVVARVGGEEFVVLLPDTDVAGARTIAQALLQVVAEQEDPVVGRVTISAGVAGLRGPEEEPATLLDRADAALYRAKREGRNRVCAQA